MKTVTEFKQYAYELGIENLPPLQQLGDESLNKLNTAIIQKTIPVFEKGVFQKRLELYALMMQISEFHQYRTEKDVEEAICKEKDKLFGESFSASLTSSLYQYNRNLSQPEATDSLDLYEHEKAICTTAFYQNLTNALNEYSDQNDKITEQTLEVLEELERRPPYSVEEFAEFAPKQIEGFDYEERALHIERVYKPAYKIHAELIAERNELKKQLDILKIQDIRKFGLDLQTNGPEELPDDLEERANILSLLNKGLKAAIEVLRAETQDLKYGQNCQETDTEQNKTNHMKDKCDLALQSNTKILEQLRRTHTAAVVELSELQGSLQAEILSASANIELKQRDLLQIISNYAFIDSINFGQLACLQGGDYSCRASADEIKDVCGAYFINEKLWDRLLCGGSIEQMGDRCMEVVRRLEERFEKEGSYRLTNALVEDVSLTWEPSESQVNHRNDRLYEELAQCARACRNILLQK